MSEQRTASPRLWPVSLFTDPAATAYLPTAATPDLTTRHHRQIQALRTWANLAMFRRIDNASPHPRASELGYHDAHGLPIDDRVKGTTGDLHSSKTARLLVAERQEIGAFDIVDVGPHPDSERKPYWLLRARARSASHGDEGYTHIVVPDAFESPDTTAHLLKQFAKTVPAADHVLLAGGEYEPENLAGLFTAGADTWNVIVHGTDSGRTTLPLETANQVRENHARPAVTHAPTTSIR